MDNPANETATQSFGARIESALVAGWNEAKLDGEALLEKAEQFGEDELGVVESAIVATWNAYEPKAAALIKGYVAAASEQLGSGASIEEIAEDVVAQDSAGASSFLNGAMSAALQAVVASLIASL